MDEDRLDDLLRRAEVEIEANQVVLERVGSFDGRSPMQELLDRAARFFEEAT